MLLGDFNSEATESTMIEFCQFYCFKNLIKTPTCFKTPDNSKCIDLILTNKPKRFCGLQVFESGLSDFHKMTATVLKTFVKEPDPKVITYRSYKYFSNEEYRNNVFAEFNPKFHTCG